MTSSSDSIAVKVAELRGKVDSFSPVLERLTTNVEKLSAIEAQNSARDVQMGVLATELAKLAEVAKDLDKRTRANETKITAWGTVIGFIATVGPFLAKKMGFL